jgi:CubicO group peptidase (beta-lactamase class C family)
MGAVRWRTVAVAGALVVVAACTGSPDEPRAPSSPPATTATPTPSPTRAPEPVVPGETWSRDEVRGADFAALDAELAATGSSCVAVVKDGVLVHDAHWGGTDERSTRAAYSITKSMTAVLVGMAAADGDLALDDEVARHVDAWRGGASADVTIRDLLANVSGRRWDHDTDYGAMVRRAADKTAFALGLGQGAEPGTVWAYNNSAVQVLEAVLREATGQDVAELAQERLLAPLGMDDTTWGRDPAGNPTTFSGVESSCHDLARLGLLMMRDGRWAGEQLVPAAFVDEATGRSSSDLNAAYGLLWWVNRPGRVVEVLRAAGFPADKPAYDGRLAPGVPEDAFWAYGYGNEYVAVVPSEGVVAVRLGARPATPDQVTFDGFTRRVLDSLDGG